MAGVKSAFRVDDVIALVAKLAQVLSDEVECLRAMRIKDVQALQADKYRIISALEAVKLEVSRSPSLISNLSDNEKDSLRSVMKLFEQIMLKNFCQLQLAREVNTQVINAMREVVAEKTSTRAYDSSGYGGRLRGESSLRVNQVI